MKPNHTLFDDLSRMAGGAASTLLEMRHEVERMVTAQCEKMAGKMQMVTREEFEIVRDMAQKAREENESLRAELGALKKKTK